MLTILYHKMRGFSRRHIVVKDGKVIADFALVVVPITTWRLWNQPTMRYPSVRKQRFHRLGNEVSDPPITLAKIAMMLRANAGRSILPQNTIPSPRPGLPGVQLFPLPNTQLTPWLTRRATVPSAKHPAHASAYLSCNCSLCQTPNCRRRVVSDQRRPSQRVRCCRSRGTVHSRSRYPHCPGGRSNAESNTAKRSSSQAVTWA